MQNQLAWIHRVRLNDLFSCYLKEIYMSKLFQFRNENKCIVCNTIQEYCFTVIPDDQITGITLNKQKRRICAGCFADELATRPIGIVTTEILQHYRSLDTRTQLKTNNHAFAD